MTPCRDWFYTYESISEGCMFMGNNHALEIVGVSIAKFKMYNGTVCTIQVGNLTKEVAEMSSMAIMKENLLKVKRES